MKSGLISRDTLLLEAACLVRKDNFTREDSSRANALMGLAERLSPSAGIGSPNGSASRAFRSFLLAKGAGSRYGVRFESSKERRDMTEGDLALGGYLVPQGFRDTLARTMAAYDRLFDEDVCTVFKSGNGSAVPYPVIEDTQNAAEVVAETVQEELVLPAVNRVMLPAAPTYRTGIVTVSSEMLQDSDFDPTSFLAVAFGLRLARGIGPALVAQLLASALSGATATGDLNSGSPSGATQVGYQDLLALRTSVNPAYRSGPKVWWLMNDNTLSALDGLLDKNGRPILHAKLDANGNREILGYPVGICPSMPSIGAGATPIAFGALGNFITRIVEKATTVAKFTELYADFDILAYKGFMRANGALVAVAGSPWADSPVKLLTNAS